MKTASIWMTPTRLEATAGIILDTQIAYRFCSKAACMVALDIVNLLDEKYADYTSGTTSKRYSPGLPLSAYLSFTMDF
jgi:outer membrane receptor protein involved in Fe transport